MTEEHKSKIVVQTCHFAGLGDEAWRGVCISRYQPKWFRPKLPECFSLFPSWKMETDLKYGRITEDEYAKLYNERYLAHLDPEFIAQKYDGKILVCHEGYVDRKKTKLRFCHRHLVAKWLRDAGFKCEEMIPRPR